MYTEYMMYICTIQYKVGNGERDFECIVRFDKKAA